jgi:Ca2+-binding RTX toxin-like protein
MKATSRKMLAVLVAAGATAAVSMATAAGAAASSCVYDAGTQSVSVGMDPGGVSTLSVSAGSLLVDGAPCLGATTTNTDSISVAGHGGTNERLVLDQRGGVFGPGATSEFNIPEIEFSIDLGDESDTLVVYGTEGDDRMAAGQSGFALTGDGDVDALLSPGAMNLEIYLLGGDDFYNARGTFGAGLHFLGPSLVEAGPGDDFVRGSTPDDVIDGGDGNDELEGNGGSDDIDAGPGNDSVNAGADADVIDLGTGADSVVAGAGSDTVIADDEAADISLLGGADSDTIVYDCGGVDPAPSGFEVLACGGTPPPPTPGPCQYDSETKKVTATMAAGESARIAVSAGAVVFGTTTLEPCGGANTGNTDTINVLGPAGSVESLVVDLATGGFVGGTPESNGVSEMELVVSLGDANDSVRVSGSALADTIVVGTYGIGLTGDTDVDVTFSLALDSLAIDGLGGADVLSGKGGSGTGTFYPGTLAISGGDDGDTIYGGGGNDAIFGNDGADILEGRDGNDTVDGGAGNDSLAGHAGNDTLIGGSGADSMIGSDGDDLLRADDGEADTTISGGQGTGDVAYYDGALDPKPTATETRIAV